MEDLEDFPTSEQLMPEQLMQLGLDLWGLRTLLGTVEIGLFSELTNKVPLLKLVEALRGVAKAKDASVAQRRGDRLGALTR